MNWENFSVESFLCFRWFRHITEASNAYKSRETRRGGRATTGPVDHGSVPGSNGLDSPADHLGVPGSQADLDRTGAKGPGRSHSFHEQSTSRYGETSLGRLYEILIFGL